MRKVLLAPLDPVHDVGLKLIRRGLEEAGHHTRLLPPDRTPAEIVAAALEMDADCVLLGRTLGYEVAELAARFVDLAEAAGLRRRVRLGLGGMAVRPELAAELGFDGAFGPGTTVAEAVAFVEGRPYAGPAVAEQQRSLPDLVAGYSYAGRHDRINALLDEIAQQALAWAENRTSPGVLRAQLRQAMLISGEQSPAELRRDYRRLCAEPVAAYYERGELPAFVHRLSPDELAGVQDYCRAAGARGAPPSLRRGQSRPLVFTQYGTGCLSMDAAHIKVMEGWGSDGVVHFDPSWNARTEGLLEGALSHQHDGTVVTPENLRHLQAALAPGTLWQVRAHRGLNTPETVVLAGAAGAHLTKINIAYGSLGAGTDPERLTVDGIAAMRYAAHYQMPFDVVTNEELCGVPAHKAFAGMLIVARIGRLLGGSPVLQPLFCNGPEAMIQGYMDDNYIDFNAAKVIALRQIIDAPIWPGAPIGFMTHTEDRVQSSLTTALHAALAASLGVDAVTVASSDEAYSGGPIVAASRVDTLIALQEAFRFLGRAEVRPTAQAATWAARLIEQIEQVLVQVQKSGFVAALYAGHLGSTADGAYPGRAGAGTVQAAVAR